ncbi:MAG: hypothetical protein IH596_05870 [Bacteroidales bacterium]|nr:hypothetical protein [Bacteroidales bacterium]
MQSRFDIPQDNVKEVSLSVETINDNYPPKVDLSLVTGKITELRISKSLIRQLIYKGEPILYALTKFTTRCC